MKPTKAQCEALMVRAILRGYMTHVDRASLLAHWQSSRPTDPASYRAWTDFLNNEDDKKLKDINK